MTMDSDRVDRNTTLSFEKLSSPQFDPQSFLKSALSSSATGGGNELTVLKRLKHQVNEIADESSQTVKQNVFNNYQQFIDTGKDIRFLESEVYKLNHLLSEQKRVIEQLQELSFSEQSSLGRNEVLKKSSANVRASQRKSMASQLEKVEGVSAVSTAEDRHVMLEEDLTELDTDTLSPRRKVHVFLLNDALLITTPLATQHGSTARYKYESLLALENIAVSAIKDHEEMKNVIKLLVFPAHKCFACGTPQSKRQWLNSIESAKRDMLRAGSLFRQATIRSKRKATPATRPGLSMYPSDMNPFGSTDTPRNPFDEPVDEKGHRTGLEEGDPELEWLRELPDELDVCIAQRDFDSAVECLFEGREHLEDLTDGPVARDIAEKLAQKEATLVELFSRELQQANEKNMQGGPKAARRAIMLLIRLNKASTACDLYLKNRDFARKQQVKELKIAEDPLSILRRLIRIYPRNLMEIAQEFSRLFASNPACYAVLLRFASGEVKSFIDHVIHHIFEPGPSLTVIGHTVRSVFTSFDELAAIGLDLTFEVERLIMPAIESALEANAENVRAATKMRIAHERWEINNLQNEANLYRYLEEMADLGLYLDTFVIGSDTDRTQMELSEHACHFARTIVQLSRDLPNLMVTPKLRLAVETVLWNTWRLQLAHLSHTMMQRDKLSPRQLSVAEKTTTFVLNQVLPVSEQLFYDAEQFGEQQHRAGENGEHQPGTNSLYQLVNEEFRPLIAYCQPPDEQGSEEYEELGEV